MAKSPSTDNYTLGKGVVYFNKKDQTSGLYMGERDLGNAPEFSFNIALEKLEHFSSRAGLRSKDKEIISQITPGVRFILDEVNKDNLAMLSLATLSEVSQVAAYVDGENVTPYAARRTDLANRGIGSYVLNTVAVAAPAAFVVGDILTGVTSSATGEVIAVSGTAVGILLTSITAGVQTDFQTGEDVGNGTDTATLEVLNWQTWNAGVVLVEDQAQAIVYASPADYTVNATLKDDAIGRILVPEGSTVTLTEDMKLSYNAMQVDYTQIQAFNETIIEGKLRFVSDNAVGTQQELEAWRVSLTPDGDTAMIGDDWTTLGFVGEILKDESRAESPYMNITII